MGLEHRFFCLPGENISYTAIGNSYKVTPDVAIHDDVIRYINDTLLWVPSIYVSIPQIKKDYGLMLYGQTIINKEGAKIFQQVMNSWEDLFGRGPSMFELTGGVMIESDGKVKNPAEFYKIKIERDVLVENLHKLTEYATKALSGNFYILHVGI